MLNYMYLISWSLKKLSRAVGWISLAKEKKKLKKE